MKIALLNYCSSWLELFEIEKNFLENLFPNSKFYHICSTAISTIKAKLIVDIYRKYLK